MDIDSVRQIIGDQNADASVRALADGACVWVFLTVEELDTDLELSLEEKAQCREIFAHTGGVYAGWVRMPVRLVLGFTVMPGYDSHGNFHGDSNNGGKWSH